MLAIAACISFPLAMNSQNNNNGATTFQEQCAGCHGPDGKAQTDTGKKIGAADLTSEDVQKMSDSEVMKVVKNGNKKMPAFGDKLSNDELKAVVAYIKELGKKQ
jgi:cytochrome c6